MSAGWSGRTGGCEFAGEPAPGFSSEVWMGIQRLLCLWKCRRAVGDDGSPCTQHLGLGMQGSAAGMGGSSFLLLLRKGISRGDTNLRHSPVLRELSPLHPTSCCRALYSATSKAPGQPNSIYCVFIYYTGAQGNYFTTLNIKYHLSCSSRSKSL